MEAKFALDRERWVEETRNSEENQNRKLMEIKETFEGCFSKVS